MSSITNIAIIGAGASGTISAIHLLGEFKGPLKIFLLEKREKALFRGAAYSSSLEVELLNVPAGKMSIFSNQPTDFYDWLKGNRQSISETVISPDSFVSRRWFGDYLTERMAEARAQAPNATVKVITAGAVEVLFDRPAQNYQVKLADGGLLPADYLVFATGNEPPSHVINNFEKALLGKKYATGSWETDPFENLSPNDDLLILGSGLSMVDHALSLDKRSHKGKVYSFSRHGLLPLPQFIGLDGRVDFNEDNSQILPVLKKLRSVISDSKRQGLEWQQVINSLRDDTPAIWKQLSLSSKRIFLKRLKHFWEVHRHRMPYESARLIEQMCASGRLELLAGKYQCITSNNGELIFQYIPKGKGDLCSVKINHLINCTGPSGNYHDHNNPLITNLLAKGWMKQDELQLGIITGYNGEIITAGGSDLPRAYAIGPLRKATEWESTAVREIRMQAEQMALDIALAVNQPGLLDKVLAMI